MKDEHACTILYKIDYFIRYFLWNCRTTEASAHIRSCQPVSANVSSTMHHHSASFCLVVDSWFQT